MGKIHTLIMFAVFSIGNAQHVITYQGEEINALDAQGNKTGLWKLYDHDRGLVISAQMANNDFVSPIEYVQYGKVVVRQDKKKISLYKDGTEIKAEFRTIDGKRKLVDSQGNEFDDQTRKIYFSVAEMRPMFYGGMTTMLDFLKANIDVKKIKGHSGKVKLSFVVHNDGTITDVNVVSSTDPFLDDEAIRLVKKLPRYQPGFQAGRFVKVQYSIPLTF